MKARKMISSGCTRYLASVVDTTKEEKAKPKGILIVRNFVDVFPKELLTYHQTGQSHSKLSCYPKLHQYQRHHTEWHPRN